MGVKKIISKQPELFDKPALAVILSIEGGCLNRDAGIDKAVTHADNEIPDWSRKAYMFLIDKYLKNNDGEFQCEDVRSYAALVDFPLPPHARAWGGIIAKAAKDGFIQHTGIGPVRNAKAHRANAAIWIRIK